MVPNVEVVGGAAVACDGTPGSRGRSTPEHDRVRDSPPALVTGTGTVADRRGVDPPSPQTGDRLWKVGRDPLTGVGPAMEGTSGAAEHALLRGRAGEAALSCESSRQRAPGRAGARASGQRGGFVPGGQTNSRRRRRLRAADRHEPTTGGVRADRVGAKRSPRAVAVDGVIQRRNTSSLRRPLTRETSTGRCHESDNRPSAARHSPRRRAGVEAERFSDLGEHEAQASGSGFVSKVTSSTGSGCKPRARQPGGQLHQRATAGAVLRSSVSVVVLADRIGCRSRQAARGHSRPCAKSAWTTRDGLASGRESAHGVKERRKPARPRQSGGYGGGLSTYRKWRARKRSPGSTCRWKASRAEPSRPFWRAGDGSGPGLRRKSDGSNLVGRPRETENGGVDRGRQRSVAQLHRRRKRSGGAGTRERAPRRFAPREGTRRQYRAEPDQSWSRAVKREANRGRIVERWSGAMQDERSLAFGVSAPGTASGRACGVSATQVVRSVIERFTGARIVSRLQKSVRSIFFAPLRGAERQTEAARDSAGRRPVPDEDGPNESGDKGARSFART